MKKDILKRVLCLTCCLSLTLGVFAYRPTKAEAVFVSPAAALGASLIATVIVATTAQFFVSSGAADTIGTAVDGLVTKFIDTASLVSEYTTDTFFEEIASGVTVLEAGAIQLSATAGSLMGAFIGWLQGENGLTAGGSAVSVSESYTYSFNDDLCVPMFVSPVWGPDYNDKVLYTGPSFADDTWYNFGYAADYRYDSASKYIQKRVNGSISNRWSCPNGSLIFYICIHDSGEPYLFVGYTDGGYIYNGTNQAGIGSNERLFVGSSHLTPNTEFVELPSEIPASSALVVNPAIDGFSIADPQAAADSLLAAIYAGTLSPTVAIEAEATDIPGTDTDDDDDVIAVPGADADLLDWTKYIGQKVAAIPQAIADSIAAAVTNALSAVFVPDPVLVNDITGAFSSKFDFVEDMKKIGDDLLGMSAGGPPVVWINLERAEGNYYYGGPVKALDMSWFQRYKGESDRILGGFLWLAYLWLLFRRLPDILGGAGLVVAESQYIGEGAYVDGNTGEITGKFLYRRSKHL